VPAAPNAGISTVRDMSDTAGPAVDRAAALRRAGWSLIAAGGLFVVVATYLFAVLVPQGLSFDLFDDSAGLLTWVGGHLSLYLLMYVLYLAQQLALLGAPVLIQRHLPVPDGREFGRTFAMSAVLVSIPLAVLSSALLIMATHTSAEHWAAATTPDERSQIVLVFGTAADLAKGARVVSEVFLGVWLAWLGRALQVRTGRRAWLLILLVGLWTGVVGAWKLLDPGMDLEDWLAFLTGTAQLAAGIGVLRVAASIGGRTGG
jgi:hypothetical protein